MSAIPRRAKLNPGLVGRPGGATSVGRSDDAAFDNAAAAEGLFFKKGAASAAAFRPSSWSYDYDDECEPLDTSSEELPARRVRWVLSFDGRHEVEDEPLPSPSRRNEEDCDVTSLLPASADAPQSAAPEVPTIAEFVTAEALDLLAAAPPDEPLAQETPAQIDLPPPQFAAPDETAETEIIAPVYDEFAAEPSSEAASAEAQEDSGCIDEPSTPSDDQVDAHSLLPGRDEPEAELAVEIGAAAPQALSFDDQDGAEAREILSDEGRAPAAVFSLSDGPQESQTAALDRPQDESAADREARETPWDADAAASPSPAAGDDACDSDDTAIPRAVDEDEASAECLALSADDGEEQVTHVETADPAAEALPDEPFEIAAVESKADCFEDQPVAEAPVWTLDDTPPAPATESSAFKDSWEFCDNAPAPAPPIEAQPIEPEACEPGVDEELPDAAPEPLLHDAAPQSGLSTDETVVSLEPLLEPAPADEMAEAFHAMASDDIELAAPPAAYFDDRAADPAGENPVDDGDGAFGARPAEPEAWESKADDESADAVLAAPLREVAPDDDGRAPIAAERSEPALDAAEPTDLAPKAVGLRQHEVDAAAPQPAPATEETVASVESVPQPIPAEETAEAAHALASDDIEFAAPPAAYFDDRAADAAGENPIDEDDRALGARPDEPEVWESQADHESVDAALEPPLPDVAPDDDGHAPIAAEAEAPIAEAAPADEMAEALRSLARDEGELTALLAAYFDDRSEGDALESFSGVALDAAFASQPDEPEAAMDLVDDPRAVAVEVAAPATDEPPSVGEALEQPAEYLSPTEPADINVALAADPFADEVNGDAVAPPPEEGIAAEQEVAFVAPCEADDVASAVAVESDADEFAPAMALTGEPIAETAPPEEYDTGDPCSREVEPADDGVGEPAAAFAPDPPEEYEASSEDEAPAQTSNETPQPVLAECPETASAVSDPIEVEPVSDALPSRPSARRRSDKRSEAELQAQEAAAAKLAAVIETMLLGKSYSGYDQIEEPQYRPAPVLSPRAVPTPAPRPIAVAAIQAPPAPVEPPALAEELVPVTLEPRVRRADRVLVLVILLLILPGIFIASSLSREDVPQHQTVVALPSAPTPSDLASATTGEAGPATSGAVHVAPADAPKMRRARSGFPEPAKRD